MHIPKNWRLNAQRYQMQGGQDVQGNVEFPPQPVVQQRVIEHYTFANSEELEVFQAALVG